MNLVNLLKRPEGKTLEFKREGIEAAVYVRVDSTNRRVGSEVIEELRRFSRSESNDEQALAGQNSEVVDFRAASESFAPVCALRKSDLATLRLMGFAGNDQLKANAVQIFKTKGGTSFKTV
jgi:predicted HTH transcriptional regulator